jgi:nucleotide-binding universal stress UspA family protein
MKDILIPISEPAEASTAADQAIALYRQQPARIHLLNVQRPLPRHVSQFFGRNDLNDYYRDTGMHVLEDAVRKLEAAGVPHEDHVLVGKPAETIVQFAEACPCDEVVLGEPPQRLASIFGLGSIGSQVRHLLELHAAARTHVNISTPTA